MTFEEQLLALRKEFPFPLEDAPLSPEKIEALYSVAYDMYERGEYKRGAEFFTQLTLRSPFDPRHWKGLASCRQMLGEYRSALHAWASLALLEQSVPHPHYHAAECYLSLGEKTEAKKAIHCALAHLKQEDAFYSRAHSLLERIDANN